MTANTNDSRVTIGGILFFFLVLPFALFFGWHLTLVAALIRKWLRIPYALTMIAFYVALMMPLVLASEHYGFHFGWIAMAVILLVLILGLATTGSREAWLEGDNLEHATPSHMLLCMAYLLLPAVKKVADAAARLPPS